VHVSSQDYSYTQPWIKKQIAQSSGSAVVILCKGKKVISIKQNKKKNNNKNKNTKII